MFSSRNSASAAASSSDSESVYKASAAVDVALQSQHNVLHEVVEMGVKSVQGWRCVRHVMVESASAAGCGSGISVPR